MNAGVILEGADLGPLPFESMESVGARLAWRRGKPVPQLVREVQAVKSLKGWEGLLPGNPTNVGALATLCGWRDASEQARSLQERLGTKTYGWLHAGFRFCPLCLGAGYHSYLYDWDFMKVCPLHGCALTAQCQSCGVSVVWKMHESTLVRYGYRCARCRGYLSGVEPSLYEHLQWREQTMQIRERLAPYETFARSVIVHADLIFSTWNAFETMQCHHLHPWCNADSVRRIAVHVSLRDEGKSGAAEYRNLISLRWSVRLHNYAWIGRERADEWRLALPGMQRPYRATLRRLERWIFGGSNPLVLVAKAIAGFSNDTPNRVEDWAPTVLSYILMRYILEGGTFPGKELLANATIPRFPARMDNALYNGRIIRLSMRAYLLGLYSIIHAVVKCNGKRSVQELFDGAGFPVERFVPIRSRSQGVPASGGQLICPYVEGMPLWPFVRQGKPLLKVSSPAADECHLFGGSSCRGAHRSVPAGSAVSPPVL